jgi:hypothetical protein
VRLFDDGKPSSQAEIEIRSFCSIERGHPGRNQKGKIMLENDREAYEAGYRLAMEVDGETRYVKDQGEAEALMQTEFAGQAEIEIRSLVIACSVCGKEVLDDEAIYIGQEGDKPRPYCEDCERLND